MNQTDRTICSNNIKMGLMDGCNLEGLSGPQQGRRGPSQSQTALISQGYWISWSTLSLAGVNSAFVFPDQDSSQIELLKELLDLQKDMVVMMLSLLEGSPSPLEIKLHRF